LYTITNAFVPPFAHKEYSRIFFFAAVKIVYIKAMQLCSKKKKKKKFLIDSCIFFKIIKKK